MLHRLKVIVSLILWPISCLAGSSERQATEEAAQALADRIRPGEFEVLESRTRFPVGPGYIVIFRVRGDRPEAGRWKPYASVSLDIPDPALCGPGSTCESDLQSKYQHAFQEATEAQAVDQAFVDGGMPPILIPALGLEPVVVVSAEYRPSEQKSLLKPKSGLRSISITRTGRRCSLASAIGSSTGAVSAAGPTDFVPFSYLGRLSPPVLR